jgi:hypothetical protein
MAVDPIDAPSQEMVADPEGEVSLEPDRRGLLGLEVRVVAAERRDRFLV